MDSRHMLRPLERRVVRLAEDGVGSAEIARRFRRSPAMIARIIDLAALPGRAPRPATREVLRPLERRVLRWRSDGHDYDEIGTRFGRSAAHVKRVEGFARYKTERA